ncbi:hypothetical protein AMECASPLE_021544 [Ameca splendens]|uniref:Uncharacterized protein n=1 Tax=Ameca splendens TaxID=208324 RepID=A0ABV0ZZ72_9TELE
MESRRSLKFSPFVEFLLFSSRTTTNRMKVHRKALKCYPQLLVVFCKGGSAGSQRSNPLTTSAPRTVTVDGAYLGALRGPELNRLCACQAGPRSLQKDGHVSGDDPGVYFAVCQAPFSM